MKHSRVSWNRSSLYLSRSASPSLKLLFKNMHLTPTHKKKEFEYWIPGGQRISWTEIFFKKTNTIHQCTHAPTELSHILSYWGVVFVFLIYTTSNLWTCPYLHKPFQSQTKLLGTPMDLEWEQIPTYIETCLQMLQFTYSSSSTINSYYFLRTSNFKKIKVEKCIFTDLCSISLHFPIICGCNWY